MDNHPLAELFPMIDEGELKALAKDIKANGLQNSITVYEEKILDGRNREAACKLAGVNPKYTQYTGTDPLGHIISLNLHRRHLTESQRGVIAQRVEKMKHGGDRKSDQYANSHLETVSRKQAATMLNVSPRTVADAAYIQKHAPEKIPAIERGEKTIHKAKEEIKEKEKKSVPRGNYKDSHDIIKYIEQASLILDLIGECKPVKKWESGIVTSIMALQKKIEKIIKNLN